MLATVRDFATTTDDRVNTTEAVNLPTNKQAGDLLLMFVLNRASQSISTGPSGWTLYSTSPVASSDSGANGANDVELTIYYKACSASEASTVNVVLSATSQFIAVTMSIPQGSLTAPIEVFGSTPTISGTAQNTSVSAPSVTTAQTDALLITLHIYRNGVTWTPPGTMTEIVDTGAAIGGMSVEVSTKVLTAAGATGTMTATTSAAPGTNGRIGVALVVRGIAKDTWGAMPL